MDDSMLGICGIGGAPIAALVVAAGVGWLCPFGGVAFAVVAFAGVCMDFN